jgi:hypothetical protein
VECLELSGAGEEGVGGRSVDSEEEGLGGGEGFGGDEEDGVGKCP